jgi:hypothetical protein
VFFAISYCGVITKGRPEFVASIVRVCQAVVHSLPVSAKDSDCARRRPKNIEQSDRCTDYRGLIRNTSLQKDRCLHNSSSAHGRLSWRSLMDIKYSVAQVLLKRVLKG